MTKKKRNPPLKINATFEEAMKILSRPHPRDTMTYEKAVEQAKNYTTWIKCRYVDTRSGNKRTVKDVLAAPAVDHQYLQFMTMGVTAEQLGNIPYQIVVLFEERGPSFHFHEYLIDFEKHYKLIS